MKKTTIGVVFDEDKATAAKLYMKQKNMNLEEELTKAMEAIYTKHVPANVREFIDMRTGMALEVIGQKMNGRKEV